MKDNKLKEIEEGIYRDPNNKENIDILAHDEFKSSIIRISISILCLLISFIFLKKVNLLTIIPLGFFYTVMAIIIIYFATTILLSTVLRNKIKPFAFLLYYKIYDLLGFILLVIAVGSFVVMFLVTPTTVVGRSMENTLESGDKVLVWHMAYEPKDNDVVVVHISKKYGRKDSLYIKRVVATSGDTVAYKDNAMYVNGKEVESRQINEASFQTCLVGYGEDKLGVYEYKIPKGYSIVMGDHRSNSEDSRILGIIDNDDILGNAIFSLIPFRKIPSKKLSYE